MSASTLYDRVVLDVTLPRVSRGNSHPAGLRPGLRRPWNAREVIVGDREAAEIDRRAASMAVALLECLGFDRKADMTYPPGVDAESAEPGDGTPKSAPTHSLSELNAMPDDAAFPYGGRLSPEDAVLLCRTAAILHAGDALRPDVRFAQVRTLLSRIVELDAALRDPALPPAGTEAGRLDSGQLDALAAAAKMLEGVAATYDGPVGAVAVRWLAAAVHEDRCRGRGAPPEAVDDIWAYDPFAEGDEPGLLAAKAEHEAAREAEAEAVRVASAMDSALSGDLLTASSLLADGRVAAAARVALDVLTEEAGGIAAGGRMSLIHLHWDCLAVWQEARSGDWPEGETKKRFDEFVAFVHEAATGRRLSDLPTKEEAAEGDPFRNDPGMRMSAAKALLSWLAQEKPVDAVPPVAVGDPVPPKGTDPSTHRFLAYMPSLTPTSQASAGPANWRRRAKRSLSVARG